MIRTATIFLLAAATTALATPLGAQHGQLKDRSPSPLYGAAHPRKSIPPGVYAGVRLTLWAIILIVCGALACLVGLCFCCFFCVRRRRNNRNKAASGMAAAYTPPVMPTDPAGGSDPYSTPYGQGGMGYTGAAPPYGQYPPQPYGQVGAYDPPPPAGGISNRDMTGTPEPAAQPLNPEQYNHGQGANANANPTDFPVPSYGHQRTGSNVSLNTLNQPPVQPAQSQW